MPTESKINGFLSKLIAMNKDHQHAAINELSTTFIRTRPEDLKSILRFLITINDFELEFKLFTLLAACQTNNESHYEIIVLYNPLYDKLNSILSRGLSLKSTIILNFITALVYKDAELTNTRAQLTVHAKNMLRVSGCLRHLATFFMDSMMFPDTWKSLCQCIAECCREMRLNCDHCAHLIPVCIQKCFQGLLDAIIVLNSLLVLNEKNIQKFIRSNGIKIFTRDNLQSTACLELLCTIVQNEPEAVSCFRDGNFIDQISEILQWSGPYSLNGQWCTIILYYLNGQKPMNDITLTSKRERQRLIQDQPVAIKKSNNVENTFSNQSGFNKQLLKDSNDGNDTNKLFRNIISELQLWQSKEGGTNRLPGKRAKVNRNQQQMTTPVNIKNINLPMPPVEDPFKTGNAYLRNAFENLVGGANEMSFSFLKHDGNSLYSKSTSTKTSKFNEKYRNNVSCARVTVAEKTRQVDTSFANTNNTYFENCFDRTENFDPAITSTPKGKNKTITHRQPISSGQSFMDYMRQRDLQNKTAVYDDIKCNLNSKTPFIPNLKSQSTIHTKKSKCLHAIQRRLIEKRNQRRAQKKSPVIKNLTKRSISSRFLDAFNESCTTIIKSVKDLFKPKRETLENDTHSQPISSGQSFMDYMRQRDLQNKTAVHDDIKCNDFSQNNNDHGCITCDDTAMLRRKLQTDENLMRTIKKLKAGINMYGCNFKKISKVLWPQEKYMTPTVLYNLYRKLILK